MFQSQLQNQTPLPDGQDYEGQQEMLDKYQDKDLKSIHSFNDKVGYLLCKEMKQVLVKGKYILWPYHQQQNDNGHLRQWDLWGPILQCISMAMVMSLSSNANADYIFGMVFAVIIAGAILITFNVKFLGADISLFQSLNVIGYCMFPITLATLLVTLVRIHMPFSIKILIAFLAFVHSTLCATVFIASIVPQNKKILAVYPLGLFYFYLSSFIFLN